MPKTNIDEAIGIILALYQTKFNISTQLTDIQKLKALLSNISIPNNPTAFKTSVFKQLRQKSFKKEYFDPLFQLDIQKDLKYPNDYTFNLLTSSITEYYENQNRKYNEENDINLAEAVRRAQFGVALTMVHMMSREKQIDNMLNTDLYEFAICMCYTHKEIGKHLSEANYPHPRNCSYKLSDIINKTKQFFDTLAAKCKDKFQIVLNEEILDNIDHFKEFLPSEINTNFYRRKQQNEMNTSIAKYGVNYDLKLNTQFRVNSIKKELISEHMKNKIETNINLYKSDPLDKTLKAAIENQLKDNLYNFELSNIRHIVQDCNQLDIDIIAFMERLDAAYSEEKQKRLDRLSIKSDVTMVDSVNSIDFITFHNKDKHTYISVSKPEIIVFYKNNDKISQDYVMLYEDQPIILEDQATIKTLTITNKSLTPSSVYTFVLPKSSNCFYIPNLGYTCEKSTYLNESFVISPPMTRIIPYKQQDMQTLIPFLNHHLSKTRYYVFERVLEKSSYGYIYKITFNLYGYFIKYNVLLNGPTVSYDLQHLKNIQPSLLNEKYTTLYHFKTDFQPVLSSNTYPVINYFEAVQYYVDKDRPLYSSRILYLAVGKSENNQIVVYVVIRMTASGDPYICKKIVLDSTCFDSENMNKLIDYNRVLRIGILFDDWIKDLRYGQIQFNLEKYYSSFTKDIQNIKMLWDNISNKNEFEMFYKLHCDSLLESINKLRDTPIRIKYIEAVNSINIHKLNRASNKPSIESLKTKFLDMIKCVKEEDMEQNDKPLYDGFLKLIDNMKQNVSEMLYFQMFDECYSVEETIEKIKESFKQTGGNQHDKVLVLGRWRKVIIKKKIKYVNIKGVLVKLTEALRRHTIHSR